eukprot:1576532-Alexandrium_andersonii.AAC.1
MRWQRGCARLPFRSWCTHSVRGRTANSHRYSSPDVGRAVPEVSMDYCFLAKDESETTATVLVVKDRDSRAILVHRVLCKGRVFKDTVDQAAESVRRLGHRGR